MVQETKGIAEMLRGVSTTSDLRRKETLRLVKAGKMVMEEISQIAEDANIRAEVTVWEDPTCEELCWVLTNYPTEDESGICTFGVQRVFDYGSGIDRISWLDITRKMWVRQVTPNIVKLVEKLAEKSKSKQEATSEAANFFERILTATMTQK